jgi:hypothetical protein
VVRLFAVNRAMTSTKLLRRPTRGAIGNGLRVVTGGALASGGRLAVESRGLRHVLDVDRGGGETAVVEEGASDVVAGTRVTVAFGPALPRGGDDGWMADLALRCAGAAARPMLSHPGWYDPAAFAELVQAAEPGATVAEIAALMGVGLDDGRPAAEANITELLPHAGAQPKLVPLGADRFPGSYARERHESFEGSVPALAEAWVSARRCPPSRGRGTVTLLVNRSPVATPIRIAVSGDKRLAVFGCNLAHGLDRVPSGADYDVVLAVTSPVVPVTTEGKEPDLRPLWGVIEPALAKALRAAHRSTRAGLRQGDIKEACHQVMEEAYLKASAGGTLPANARQVYYAARPLVQALLGPAAELKDKYFTQVLLPDFVADNPGLTRDWDVVYDARGHLLEPHTGASLPVGTLQVRDYLLPRRRRSPDLVAVDGGAVADAGGGEPLLHAALHREGGLRAAAAGGAIPERFDCAVMSTKGTSVTAARLLVDRMAQRGVRVWSRTTSTARARASPGRWATTPALRLRGGARRPRPRPAPRRGPGHGPAGRGRAGRRPGRGGPARVRPGRGRDRVPGPSPPARRAERDDLGPVRGVAGGQARRARRRQGGARCRGAGAARPPPPRPPLGGRQGRGAAARGRGRGVPRDAPGRPRRAGRATSWRATRRCPGRTRSPASWRTSRLEQRGDQGDPAPPARDAVSGTTPTEAARPWTRSCDRPVAAGCDGYRPPRRPSR